MQDQRRKILQYALNLNITDVHTYAGYRGDLMVKIITNDESVMNTIREYALSLNIKEVVVKHSVEYVLYCVTAEGIV
jgi:hypothetical protein